MSGRNDRLIERLESAAERVKDPTEKDRVKVLIAKVKSEQEAAINEALQKLQTEDW